VIITSPMTLLSKASTQTDLGRLLDPYIGEELRTNIELCLAALLFAWAAYAGVKWFIAQLRVKQPMPDDAGPLEVEASGEEEQLEEPNEPAIERPIWAPKRSLAELDPRYYPMTPDRQLIMALGAFYQELAGRCATATERVEQHRLWGDGVQATVIELFGELDNGGRFGNAAWIEERRRGLIEWWDLESREEVEVMVSNLMSGRLHQERWAQIANRSTWTPENAVPVAKASFVYKFEALVGPVGISAWDMARAVQVTRLAVSGRLLTPEQGWQLLAPLPNIARNTFPDWRSYAVSYLVGLQYWKLPSDEPLGTDEEVLGRQMDANTLLTHPYSIWQWAPLSGAGLSARASAGPIDIFAGI
jgi:hypothetical protein